jgi:hypothetical protein
MRLFNTVLALLVLTASTVANAADDAMTSDEAQARFDAERKHTNSANDPTEPRLTLEYWNFYAPSLNNLSGGAENGEGRILIPSRSAAFSSSSTSTLRSSQTRRRKVGRVLVSATRKSTISL